MSADGEFFKKVLGKAVEPVGKEAFRIVYKALSDGLPPNGLIAEQMWHTDYVDNQLPDDDARKIATLALRIEKEATRAVASLFLDKDFRAALKRDMLKGHMRQNAKARHKRRTDLFEDIVKSNPTTPTKTIVRQLEREEKIIDRGDQYEIAGTGALVGKNSIPSKLSRLRKQLRNT